jgi:hypothetical protein
VGGDEVRRDVLKATTVAKRYSHAAPFFSAGIDCLAKARQVTHNWAPSGSRCMLCLRLILDRLLLDELPDRCQRGIWTYLSALRQDSQPRRLSD